MRNCSGDKYPDAGRRRRVALWLRQSSITDARGTKIILLALAAFANCLTGFAQGLIKYVQPLSGTAPSSTISALKHSEAGSEKNANTIPAVGLPFGMTQWVAQTRTSETKCIPPYLYTDSVLTGFRGTHWISGSCMQDYGSVSLMPVVGELKTKTNGYAIRFSHEDEISTPACYKVKTEKFTAWMAASLRCGLIQISIPVDDSLYLLIMPNSDYEKGFIKVDTAKGIVYGCNPVHRIYQGWGEPAGFNGWFYVKFDKQFKARGIFDEEAIFSADSSVNKKGGGAYIGFKLQKGERLLVRIGTSLSSLDGASRNLEKEIANKSFNDVRDESEKTWEILLGKIKVETDDEKVKNIFYTSLYHAFQQPRLYNDVDGMYPAFAGHDELMNADNRNYYDDFSMWDIYRAQLPLLELLDNKRTNDFVQSMIWKGQQGGWLPIFPCWNSYSSAMIGDHVTAFIASAYNKGIRKYDVNAAYGLMRKNAFAAAQEKDYVNGKGRRALASYIRYGYIPVEDSVPVAFHQKEQVSRTLEYAFDDYALSTMAKALGKNDDYIRLNKRALNYKNVFDPEVKMANGRYVSGNWYKDFNADKREYFITEGTPRQYTFYVPQDVPGLAALMGGRKALEDRLDSLFVSGGYWHGNEPGHQIPFMYNFTASPWKTQKMVLKILTEEYSEGPGGLSGNDDAGQMSAWYVFAAMGLYPLDPVSGNYLLCSPLFDSITIQLPGNKTFRIVCHKTRQTGSYISEAKLNGINYTKNYLQHGDITRGGRLDMWLGVTPSEWGSKVSDQPKGLSSK